MTGEGFPASITSSAGFKGDALSFTQPASQRMSQPVHQGFTPPAGQTRLQNVYVMAIRNMMEQGFHSFVSLEPETPVFPGLSQFSKGMQQLGSFPSPSPHPGVQGKDQNDFLASTPQYLLPQFQRSSAKANTPAFTPSPQKQFPGGIFGQSVQGFAQPAMNEFNKLQKTFDRGAAQKRFTSEDAENLFIEHYRSTFGSPRETERTKYSGQQKSQGSQPGESSGSEGSSSSRNIYAEAYQRRMGKTGSSGESVRGESARSGEASEKSQSREPGGYYIKMGSPRKKEESSSFSSEKYAIKMELPGKKTQFVPGESMLKMSTPRKNQAVTPGPEKTGMESQKGAVQKQEITGRQKTGPSPEAQAQPMKAAVRPETLPPGTTAVPPQKDTAAPRRTVTVPPQKDTAAPQRTVTVPPQKDTATSQKTVTVPPQKDMATSQRTVTVPPQKDTATSQKTVTVPPQKDTATSQKTAVTTSQNDAAAPQRATMLRSHKEPAVPQKSSPMSPQNDPAASGHSVLSELEKLHSGLLKKDGADTTQGNVPRDLSSGGEVKSPMSRAPQTQPGDNEKLRPDLMRTAVEERKGEALQKPLPGPKLPEQPLEAKVDDLLQKLDRDDASARTTREQPVKGKEMLQKPWESPGRTLVKPAPSQEKPSTGEMPAEKALTPGDQRKSMPILHKPVESAETLRPQAPQVEREVMQKENPLEKLREEVRLKLDTPQAPAAGQRHTLSELAAKTGVIQTQGPVSKKDDQSIPKQTHFEEIAEAPDTRSKSPLKEKQSVASKSMGRQGEETAARKKGDAPIESIRGIEGRAGSFSLESTVAPAFVPQENRQTSTPQGKFDLRQGDGAPEHKIVDELQRHQRDSGGEQGERGFQEQGRERGFTYSKAKLTAATQSPGQAVQSQQQQQQAEAKQQIYSRAYKDSVRLSEARKQEPIQQAQQAIRHASTCIESILKKSHSETWTGDEMAAKLIAILMKSASGFTYDHSSRVTDLSVALAKEMGVHEDDRLKQIKEGAMFHDIGELELDLQGASPQVQERLAKYIGTVDLKNCSFLHDIGKVKIPESILYKPGRLTDEEFEMIKQHPVIGEQILRPIPSLRHTLPVVRHHHEKYDGTGYPDGLKGNEIPLAARIVCITDSFDAMVSDRPYRKGLPVEKAVEELRNGAGTQFDPELVEAFLKVVEREYQ